LDVAAHQPHPTPFARLDDSIRTEPAGQPVAFSEMRPDGHDRAGQNALETRRRHAQFFAQIAHVEVSSRVWRSSASRRGARSDDSGRRCPPPSKAGNVHPEPPNGRAKTVEGDDA
jgi:hypothetical protein